MAQKGSKEYEWLMKTHPSFRWRLVGPNIKNPFDSLASDEKLESYVNDKSALMENCSVQCVMDDTLVVKITELTGLRFESEHPNLMNLQREDLDAYLKKSGVWDFINTEFVKLQKACKDELQARQSGKTESY